MSLKTLEHSDAIELVRRVNPLPNDPPAPPIGPLLERRDEQAISTHADLGRIAPARRASSSRRRRALVLVPIVVAGLLIGFGLFGGTGDRRQFDVAAAVYRAITPGSGVLHVVMEEEVGTDGKHSFARIERWSRSNPPSERTIWIDRRNYGREHFVRIEAAIAPGSTWSSWGTNHPDVIERTTATGVAARSQVDEIRAAYRAGRLRVLEKTTLDGRAVYRLELVPRRKGAAGRAEATPEKLLVDAATFVPIETVEYARAHDGRLVPVFAIRYRTYKELPPTPENLALLNMAPHPGAHVLER
jgi:hypothetical protein